MSAQLHRRRGSSQKLSDEILPDALVARSLRGEILSPGSGPARPPGSGPSPTTCRTAVRNLERASVSRSVAMSLTGHKTEAVYRRYSIVDSTAQREGVAKLVRAQGTIQAQSSGGAAA
jgi:hypothetical protein